jgi:hypothetical protein
MTPDRRLDQLEPLMADVLQKVDRLIEGQGQLVELATGTKVELDQVKATGDITANGLAKLTIVVNDLRDEVREGFKGVTQRFDRNEQTQQEILTILRDRLK